MRFALRILRLCASLPKTPEARLIRGQLFRAGTSPGAQHREAARARSVAEFISKIESGQQELDETAFWLEFLDRAGIVRGELLTHLRGETEELLKIFASSARTAKERKRQ
jgi:four helix bundle protein